MNKECEIIRDLLPLYADSACSASSREIIDEHLKACPGCTAYLRDIRDSEAESALKAEKALVIQNQARRFKRRSAVAGSVISALFMIPILVCLIVNLTSGRTLEIVVPLTVEQDKLFWTFCAFCVSLIILLAVCALYTRGSWFFVAASASLFGLSVIFLPFVIKARPLRPWVRSHNKTWLVLAVDLILFGNMMNVISWHQKGFGFTMLIAVLIVAALGVLVTKILLKGREQQR